MFYQNFFYSEKSNSKFESDEEDLKYHNHEKKLN